MNRKWLVFPGLILIVGAATLTRGFDRGGTDWNQQSDYFKTIFRRAGPSAISSAFYNKNHAKMTLETSSLTPPNQTAVNHLRSIVRSSKRSTTSIEADMEIQNFSFTPCEDNREPIFARTTISMYLFNSKSSEPSNGFGEVMVVMALAFEPEVGIPVDRFVVKVVAIDCGAPCYLKSAHRPENASASRVLFEKNFGTVSLHEKVHLGLRWHPKIKKVEYFQDGKLLADFIIPVEKMGDSFFGTSQLDIGEFVPSCSKPSSVTMVSSFEDVKVY